MKSKQLYPKAEKVKTVKKHRYRVDYRLIYDGPCEVEFTEYYRTYIGARISAFLHHYLRSWGGTVRMYDTRLLVP